LPVRVLPVRVLPVRVLPVRVLPPKDNMLIIFMMRPSIDMTQTPL
jgi:hypothetical protein